MNLTIPNLTPDQATSIQQQIAGGGGGSPPPDPGNYDFSAIKAAPSNWAAYTFCNGGEWGALDAAYGTEAVNAVKNYYMGHNRMNGYPTPGDPATGLRENGAKPPIRYYFYDKAGKPVEDTGQADAVQTKITGQAGPTLPVRA